MWKAVVSFIQQFLSNSKYLKLLFCRCAILGDDSETLNSIRFAHCYFLMARVMFLGCYDEYMCITLSVLFCSTLLFYPRTLSIDNPETGSVVSGQIIAI